jgi:DNA-binding GntR family transcriptional regulator
MQQTELRTVSTVDALAAAIRELILDGEMLPGERLRELEWSERYGVGRQTFRAAAQQLCFLGLLENRPNRGFSVRELDADSIADVYRIRRALTVEALRCVMETGDVPVLATQAIRDLEVLGDDASWSEVADACERFYRALIDGAHSPRLARAYDGVASEVLLCIGLATGRFEYPARVAASQHGEILRLIESGDVPAAETALAQLLAASAANVTRAYEERHRRPHPRDESGVSTDTD